MSSIAARARSIALSYKSSRPIRCCMDGVKPPMLTLRTEEQYAAPKPGFAPRVTKGGQLDLECAIKDMPQGQNVPNAPHLEVVPKKPHRLNNGFKFCCGQFYALTSFLGKHSVIRSYVLLAITLFY